MKDTPDSRADTLRIIVDVYDTRPHDDDLLLLPDVVANDGDDKLWSGAEWDPDA